MSRDWVADPEECNTVGEVYLEPRYYNARRAIPHALGTHICGTLEQWAGEAKYNPAVNVTYNRDGLPSCCGIDPLPRGGLEFGGNAAVAYTPPSYAGPGPSCETATEIAAGETAGGTVPFNPSIFAGVWYKFGPTVDEPTGTYHVETTGLGDGAATITFLLGSCSGFFSVTPTRVGNRWTFSVPFDTGVMLRLGNTVGGAAPFTLVWGHGP